MWYYTINSLYINKKRGILHYKNGGYLVLILIGSFISTWQKTPSIFPSPAHKCVRAHNEIRFGTFFKCTSMSAAECLSTRPPRYLVAKAGANVEALSRFTTKLGFQRYAISNSQQVFVAYSAFTPPEAPRPGKGLRFVIIWIWRVIVFIGYIIFTSITIDTSQKCGIPLNIADIIKYR